MSGRLLKVSGVAAAGAVGYYLYQAGGNPKVAEKQAEHDAARLSNKVRSELPGYAKEAKTDAKLYGEKAGAKFDSASQQLKDATYKADGKIQGYAADASKKLSEAKQEVGSSLTAGVDKFDKTVEKKAAETKGWLGGWFGGK